MRITKEYIKTKARKMALYLWTSDQTESSYSLDWHMAVILNKEWRRVEYEYEFDSVYGSEFDENVYPYFRPIFIMERIRMYIENKFQKFNNKVWRDCIIGVLNPLEACELIDELKLNS